MRRTTALMSQWKADSQNGESLHFEACKGGYFSNKEEYGLKIIGKTSQEGTPTSESPMPIQCVKAGTKIKCVGKNLFGGMDLADKIMADVPNATQDTENKTVLYSAAYIYGKTILSGIFKENTQYTIILSGYCNSSINGYSNLQVNYTDGTEYQYLFVGGGNNTKGTAIYVTDANKTVDCIKGTWHDGGTTLYYEECGVFEGNIGVEDFEPYIKHSEITVPCDLFEGDTYLPILGLVKRQNETVEEYTSQSVFAPQGAFNVIQEAIDLTAQISATTLVHRTLSEIPNQYQQVEYIESTGTQYINTEIIFKNTTYCEIDFQLTRSDIVQGIMGGWYSLNNTTAQLVATTANLIVKWRANEYKFAVDTKRHNVILSNSGISVDNLQFDFTDEPTTDGNKSVIFARRASVGGGSIGENGYMKLYGCKLYNEKNNLLRNFIPCYRKEDGEIGLYDIVSKQFFTNQGTGNFLKGANV